MTPKTQQKAGALSGRVLVVAFLIVSLILITVYFREGSAGPIHSLQNAVSGITTPFKFVGGAIGSGTGAVGSAFENAAASEESLSSLRQYNQELIDEIAKLEEYRQENERLQALLDIKDTYGLDTVAARVTQRNSNAWEQTITINRGSNDGIKAGLAVMGANGVIGQVISVESSSCDVRLLSDPMSGVAVMLQASRAEGVVYGSVEGLLYLKNVDADAEVQVGDMVITSGLGGRFPHGLTVGMVVKVDSVAGDSSRTIIISPNESTGPLEEVLVVVGMNESNEEAKNTQSASEFSGEGEQEGSEEDGQSSQNATESESSEE